MKKFILLLLLAVFLISPLEAFADEPAGELLVYTAIGDSITAGMNLPSYKNDGDTPKEGYVAIIGERLGATVINDLGASGITTSGVIDRLNNNEKYKSDIRKADIITLSLGSNDLLIPGLRIMEEIFIFDDDYY